MTIYLVQWSDIDTGQSFREAFSSMTKAEKKLRELNKIARYIVKTSYLDEQQNDVDDAPIQVVRPKTQADVIKLINSL